MRQRLDNILNKDLSELEQKVQEKENQFNDIASKNGQNTEHMEKVGDELEELQLLLDNFLTSRDKAQKNIQDLRPNDTEYEKAISLNLKKMIIAEKQLDTKLPILTRKN